MNESNDPQEKSRRTLAAIVFTDIVNFSALTQQDEDRTLRLARRDLDHIRKICQLCEGRVLKMTGDGLLMYFHSAVQAVACALRTQSHLASMAEKLPADETLQHRIGIHLGDVFVSEDDVMGDGVNIASRIQEEAPPGGICVSQTVYDVVKNRLGVKVTPLGPRELKNIKEAVPVYQILLEAAGGETPLIADETFWTRRKLAVVLIGAVAVCMVAAGVYLSRPEPPSTAPAGSVPAVSSVRPDAEDISPENRPRRDRPAGTRRARVGGELDQARRQYLLAHDFAGFAKWLEQHDLGKTKQAENYRELAKFKRIVGVRLMSSGKEDPIVIDVPVPDGSVQLEIWAGEDGKFWVKGGRNPAGRQINRIPMRFMIRVYQAVAQTKQQRALAAFLVFEAESLTKSRPR